MKPIKSLLILLVLLAPSAAFAQGYYGGPRGGGYYQQPPPTLPGGFHDRSNRLIFGFSLGLGGMSDKGGDLECAGCDYNPLAAAVSAHIGGFVGPRLALMAELQGNVQTIAQDSFGPGSGVDTSLVQAALMGAAQYWLTPQLWIKGGIGFASVQVQDEDFFGVVAESRPQNGIALLGAVGFELLSSKYFSVDLQGRILNGSYKSLDNHITAASIGIGINWF
ncbi:MAG: hypothetical protein KF773_04715 [Deltaproteobacteria bacterium]|nr:hypothetical protein [Deltaproteobacteria bacterium]MCW5801007.1 hypothetical protein [Deltaproteobacteria bacterium]